MKHKRLLSMLVLLAAVATGAWAQPWTSGDCTVTLTNGELKVSKTSGDGDGAMANTIQRQRPWYNYLKSITSVVVEEGVTHIGTSAFLNCTNLASATIPASVTSIGNQAFQTCTGMTSVIIADGSSLTSIGSSAFYGCINLGSITLPASVTSIGQRAFNMCNNLATVTLNSNPFIGSEAFDGIKDGAVVTMNLTATSADDAKWTTFYNEAYGFQADANTEVFKVALSGTDLTLNKVESGIVDAGTAVVLKTTGDKIVMTLTTTASSDTQDNSLTGVSAAAGATSDGTFYVLNNGASGIGFYRLASGDIVPVGNAYLTSDSQNDFLSIGGGSGSGSGETSTYTVSFAENTEDADNWTGKAGDATEYQKLPLEGVAAGAALTLKYDGTKKVKSVKAVKKGGAPKPDLLPAVFTVDAGKTVKFSKGNLQATYNGSSWIWGFAEHQWDYIGNAAGNTSINGNGTVSANGTVDLFGWVGASSTWTGAAQYGISNSTATNNVDGYGNVGGEAQKVGWGATVDAGWRTLTKNEWLYLLSERATGVTVNSTDNARYTQASINTDGTAVNGLLIFPDGYTGGTPAGVTWGTINAKSTFNTTCTSAGWTALEAAGCVFLPAAGYREASNVTDAGVGGGYWSSSSSNATYAFGLYFESDYMTIQYGGSRKYGFSVRLVRDAN